MSLVVASVALSLGGLAQAQSSPWIPAQEELARGVLDGVERRFGPPLIELAPDGKSILYYQGLPWPRLMRLPVGDAGAAAEAVCREAPFARHRPRFGPRGRVAYFTADTTWKPRRRAAGRDARALRLAVARVDLQSEEVRHLAPSSRRGASASAVFFDRHPTEGRLLVGLGRELHSSSASDEALLELVEISTSDGSETPLGPRVKLDSLARYSGDGRFVVHAPAGASKLFAHERPTGANRPLPRAISPGWRSGAFEIAPAHARHVGGLGGESFPAYLVRRSPGEAGVALSAPWTSLRVPGAPTPLAIRADRVLYRLAPPVDASWAIVALPDADLERALASRDAGGRPQDGEPWRATVDAGARPWIERIAASLQHGPGTPPTVARATWTEVVERDGEPVAARTTITEHADGRVRLVHTLPPENLADLPPQEVIAFDGDEALHVTFDRTRRIISMRELRRRVDPYSPFALLIDPLGLGLERTRIDLDSRPPDDRPPRLRVRHASGFEARIDLESIAGQESRVVPVSIRATSPDATTASGVELREWRAASDRLVPHEVRRLDGATERVLRLDGLSLEADLEKSLKPGD